MTTFALLMIGMILVILLSAYWRFGDWQKER